MADDIKTREDKNNRGKIKNKAKSETAKSVGILSDDLSTIEAKAKIITAVNKERESLIEKEIQLVKLKDRLAKKDHDATNKELKDKIKAEEEISRIDDSRLEKNKTTHGGKATSAIEKLYKGATNADYAKSSEMGAGSKVASSILKSVMSQSGAVSTGLGMLAGAINPTTAAMMALEWAAEQAVKAFIEGYKAMQEIQKTAAYRTSLNSSDLGKVLGDWAAAQKAINVATDPIGTGGLFKRITTTEMLGTMSKVLTEFKNINIDGKGKSAVNDPAFIKLALGLEEMGYDIAGGIGEVIKSQYYRNNQNMTKSNDLLNRLVGLSKVSSLSLDELVNIMSATTEAQNLSAWTFMRNGMSSEDATANALRYGKSKSAVSAAADTMGISQSGVDAIYSLMTEIVSAKTDPTKYGELTRKAVVGGMTGGKSIDQIYQMMTEGKFTEVFKLMVGSAAATTLSSNTMGPEFLSREFGSIISTVIESFGPSTVSQMLSAVDTMSSTMESQQPAILDTIDQSIANAPVTLEDILNSFFDAFILFGANVAGWFDQLLHPLSALEKLFGGASKSYVDITGVRRVDANGITGETYRAEVERQMALTPIKDKATQYEIAEYNKVINAQVMRTLSSPSSGVTPISTEPPNDDLGQGNLDLKDYYITDTAGWYNNDIRGINPFRISAGFMSPAYKARFGDNHRGVDYAASRGTAIPSSVDGTVVAVGYDKDGGNYVKVQDAEGRIHYYGHMDKQSVKKGDRVTMGQTLGLVGSTGTSTGNHVHYGVKQSGTWINPNKWAGNSFAGLYKNRNTATATPSPSGIENLYGAGTAGSTTSSINPQGKVTSATHSYYGTTDIVDSINNLNSMLSQKLDVVIEKLGSKSGLKSQFSYMTK